MASTRSRIEIEIAARVEGFRDAVRGAQVEIRSMAAAVKDGEKAFDAFGTGIARLLKTIGVIGLIGNASQFIVGFGASLVNLLPILFVIPGAILAMGAAVATVKLAFSGFGDALGGDAEAMAKLAPAAQATAKAVLALKPAFDNLRKAVQQEFFKGFADDVKLIGGIYLPILQSRLPQVAAAFNAMGHSAATTLADIPARLDFKEVLDNTIASLGNMKDALGNVISGFLGLAGVGSERLPALGKAIDNVAARFRAWVDENVESGAIDDMIQRAIDGFKSLGELVGNTGRIFTALFTGLSQGAGKDFVQTLADSAGALADFLAQAEQQEALQTLGKAFADISEVTRTVFIEALKQLSPIIIQLAPVLAEMARVIGETLVNALTIVGPLLTGVAGFLNDNKQAVADITPLIIGLWAAFKGASILTTVATNLGPIITRLGGMSTILKGGLIVAVGAFAIKLDEMNKSAAAQEGRPLSDMEDNLDNLVGAFQQLASLDFAGIFADIGDEWQVVVDKFNTGESPIGGFFMRLGAALEQTRQSFVDIGTFISDFVTTTGTSFATIGQAIGDGFTTAVDTVTNFFTVTVPTAVSDGFTAVTTFIGTKATEIGTAFSDAFNTAKDAVTTKLTEIGTSISDFFSQTPAQIGFAIGAVIGDIITFGIQLATEFGTAAVNGVTTFIQFLTDGFNNAVTFVTSVPGMIGDALSSLVDTLTTAATNAGTAFLLWLSNFFTDTTTRASEVPGQVGDAVAGTVTTLGDKAREAGQAFLDFLKTAFDNTVQFVSTAPGRIGDAISSVVTILADKARTAGQSFIDGITTAFTNAVTYVQGVPGRISAAIGNLGGLLVNAGRQAIDGLLSGIKAGYQNMIDFVGGIAAGIAAHKGPLSYDRTVLIPAGLALMEGLLSGLRTGNDDVQDFVSGIAAQLADPFATSFTASAAGVSTLPASASSLAATAQSDATDRLIAALNTQAVQVTVMLDGQPFKAMVGTAIVEQDRDTARRIRAGGGTSW